MARLAAVRPVWSNALSLGGHFIPDATSNVAVDINGTNRPEIYVTSSNIDAPEQWKCCTLRACLEQVARRILLQRDFLKVRRIPSGVISAIGMRSWPISPASETTQRVLAIRGDLDSRDLVGAEMASREATPIRGN